MKFTKKMREEFFNPDGSIKRMPKVVEVRPDGARVLETGWLIHPSMIDCGERGLVRLDSLTPEEHARWEEALMKKVGKGMSDFYAAQATGAFNYNK